MNHMRIAGAAALVTVSLLASPVADAGIHVAIVPELAVVAPGDTFSVAVIVNPADSEFNAFDLFLSFDPDRLAFVPTSPVSAQLGPVMTNACPNMFHLFTAAPSLLQANVSLLCAGTFVTGPGTIYQVRFRAGTELGETSIDCGVGTSFYRAGFFVLPVDCAPATVMVSDGTVGVDGPASAPAAGLVLLAPSPNPAAGGSGDAQLTFRLGGPDEVTLELFDVRGRLVARRAGEWFGSAGWQTVRWAVGPVPSGAYFVRGTTRGGSAATARWVVAR